MWHDLFVSGVPLAEKVVRTVAVYGAIAILLRLAGKRDLAAFNTFDLVVMLLLSNVVQNAIIGNDNSLLGGLIGAVVLVVINAAVVRVTVRSDRLARLFEGTPTVLVRNGHYSDAALNQEGLRKADVLAALRRQGASSVEEVEEMVLAPGGALVVKLMRDKENATRGDVAALAQRVEHLETKLDALLTRLDRP